MRRRKPKIQIITAPCRRGCGTQLATASRSIYGADEAKRKYELICNDCLTAEEKEHMHNSIANAAMSKMRGQ
jgi:hypothetical protein